jgi:ribosomal protein S18 acetylase RimI-like enzyme
MRIVSQFPYDELKVRLLLNNDDLSDLWCAEEDLNDFLKNNAKSYHDLMLGRTYLCIYKDKVVGFMTLSIDTIRAEIMQEEDKLKNIRIKSYPALKIARLAIDIKYERKGIGKFLVLIAIGKALELSRTVGCRLIIVDSKPDAILFYKKLEFKLMKEHQERSYPIMYFDLYPSFKSD